MASSTFTTLCNHHHNLFPKLFRHLKLKFCNHETGTLVFHLKDEQLVVGGGGAKGMALPRYPISPLNPLSPGSIYWKADLCGQNSVKSLRWLSFWLTAHFGQGEALAGPRLEYVSAGSLPGRGCVVPHGCGSGRAAPSHGNSSLLLPFRSRGCNGFLSVSPLVDSLNPSRTSVKNPLVEGSSVSL